LELGDFDRIEIFSVKKPREFLRIGNHHEFKPGSNQSLQPPFAFDVSGHGRPGENL
jgi:hypothetical protein